MTCVCACARVRITPHLFAGTPAPAPAPAHAPARARAPAHAHEHEPTSKLVNDQIWAGWNCAVQVFNKINDRFWDLDGKILKSRLGVYTYLIASAVIIGVLAVWIVMSQGLWVCGRVDGLRPVE